MLTLTLFLIILFFPINSDASEPTAIAGKFTPPGNKTLLFVGQDSDTIADYVKAMPEDKLEAVTLYTSLKSTDPDKALPGIFSTANWQAGDVNFAQTLSLAPGAALAIGLAIDQCNQPSHSERIAAGEYDQSLAKLVKYLKSLAPRKVFLRIGYEFDGPWNCYEPESYKAAFRHISNALRNAQANNVTTVWQSASWPDPTIAGERSGLYDHRRDDLLALWYPGDDVVDWVAISTFYRDLSQWNFTPVDRPEVAQQKAVEFARAHNKPLMIAEAAPQAYRIGAQTKSYIALNKQTPHSAKQIWQDWFVPFFDFVHKNRDVIRAVAYINTYWENQPMWYCGPGSAPPAEDCPQGNWGDSRVQAHPYIKQKWLEQISDEDMWIQHASY